MGHLLNKVVENSKKFIEEKIEQDRKEFHNHVTIINDMILDASEQGRTCVNIYLRAYGDTSKIEDVDAINTYVYFLNTSCSMHKINSMLQKHYTNEEFDVMFMHNNRINISWEKVVTEMYEKEQIEIQKKGCTKFK